MNQITVHGKLIDDAQKFLITTSKGETPLVTFYVLDSGLPYQRGDPLIIEVHFIKEVASHIFKHLKKDKEIILSGFLKQKNYTTADGIDKGKYYISAEYVTLLPKYKTE